MSERKETSDRVAISTQSQYSNFWHGLGGRETFVFCRPDLIVQNYIKTLFSLNGNCKLTTADNLQLKWSVGREKNCAATKQECVFSLTCVPARALSCAPKLCHCPRWRYTTCPPDTCLRHLQCPAWRNPSSSKCSVSSQEWRRHGAADHRLSSDSESAAIWDFSKKQKNIKEEYKNIKAVKRLQCCINRRTFEIPSGNIFLTCRNFPMLSWRFRSHSNLAERLLRRAKWFSRQQHAQNFRSLDLCRVMRPCSLSSINMSRHLRLHETASSTDQQQQVLQRVAALSQIVSHASCCFHVF